MAIAADTPDNRSDGVCSCGARLVLAHHTEYGYAKGKPKMICPVMRAELKKLAEDHMRRTTTERPGL